LQQLGEFFNFSPKRNISQASGLFRTPGEQSEMMSKENLQSEFEKKDQNT